MGTRTDVNEPIRYLWHHDVLNSIEDESKPFCSYDNFNAARVRGYTIKKSEKEFRKASNIAPLEHLTKFPRESARFCGIWFVWDLLVLGSNPYLELYSPCY